MPKKVSKDYHADVNPKLIHKMRAWSQRSNLVALIAVLILFGIYFVIKSRAAITPPTLVSKTITPAQLPSTTDLVNPMRGFYEWRTINFFQSQTPNEAYERYWWNDLEPDTKGVYKLDKLITDIKTAQGKGQRFGFRVRAMAGKQGLEPTVMPATNIEANHLPKYMTTNNYCATIDSTTVGGYGVYVPKWNDPCFRTGLDGVLKAINARIVQEGLQNSIAWIDIGTYGQWGEWSMYQSTNPDPAIKATGASLKGIVDSYITNLGTYPLLMMVGADKAYKTDATGKQVVDEANDPLVYAMSKTSVTTPDATHPLAHPIGLRTDCVDCAGYLDGKTINSFAFRLPSWIDRWQTAPFVSEVGASGGATASVLDGQVTKYHISSVGNGNVAQRSPAFTSTDKTAYSAAVAKSGYRYSVNKLVYDDNLTVKATARASITFVNSGIAPTYEKWLVNLIVKDSLKKTISTTPLVVNLSDLKSNGLASTVVANSTYVAPTTPGTYGMYLQISDPLALPVRHPMRLALQAAPESDGSYLLTNIFVYDETVSSPPAVDMPPVGPTQLTVDFVGSLFGNHPQLYWNQATDDKGIAGYQVKRDGSLVGTTAASIRQYFDASVAPDGSVHTYQVFAVDTAGKTATQASPVLRESCWWVLCNVL